MSTVRTTFAMCFSLIALSLTLTVHADETASSAAPPDRAALEAAMSKCAAESGVVRGERPTREQHITIEACMKTAGFERPRRGERPPGPPPEGSPASDEIQPIRSGNAGSAR